MKSKIKKQNAISNAVLPGKFLDKLMISYPSEYNVAHGIANNAITLIASEAEKMKPFSFEEYCYWFFLADFVDRYIKQFQDQGIIDYRKRLHHTRQGVKKLE